MRRFVFQNSDLVFHDVFELAMIDTNKALAVAIAFRATYYTFAPQLINGALRGLSKYFND